MLVPQSGIKYVPPATEAQNLLHRGGSILSTPLNLGWPVAALTNKARETKQSDATLFLPLAFKRT